MYFDKSLERMLPGNRKCTPINNTPSWLQEYTDKWHAIGASSVVLFGSRGCGLALPDSDWDIAVLFDGASETPPSDSVSLPSSVTRHHEVCTLSLSITDMRPSLVREVSSGVVLSGYLNNLITHHYEGDLSAIDREDMMFLLKHGFISILQCFRVVSRTLKRSLNPKTRKTVSLAELGNSTSESM